MTAPVPEPADDDHGTYEVRTNGLLGPLLLDALPHAAVSLEPRHTLVLTETTDGRDLIDVLELLVANGVEVESVREVKRADVPPASE
jgi:hypothetical protein